MPLTDLVRHINARHAREYPERGEIYLYKNNTVTARYGSHELQSRFLAIHGPGALGRSLYGHAATVAATLPGRSAELGWDRLFQPMQDRREDVYLDRLIRTLHALNYLSVIDPSRPGAEQARERGRLVLPVHRRHLLGVSAHHGLAFEEILRACGLAPERIVLELDVTGVPLAHLLLAVENYRSRGYGIALAYRAGLLEQGLLDGVRPDLLRLPGETPAQRRIELQAQVYTWGGQILAEAGRNGSLFGPVDLVQEIPTPLSATLAA